MKLAKPHLDVGIFTNDLDRCWRSGSTTWAAVRGDAATRRRRTPASPRHERLGAKLNHARDPLPDATAGRLSRTGDRARGHYDGSERAHRSRRQPRDAAPPGTTGYAASASDLPCATRRPSIDSTATRCSSSMRRRLPTAAATRSSRSQRTIRSTDGAAAGPRLSLHHGPGVGRRRRARGHHRARRRRGPAARTLGATARVSFVRDPDGNWIEISQRRR